MQPYCNASKNLLQGIEVHGEACSCKKISALFTSSSHTIHSPSQYRGTVLLTNVRDRQICSWQTFIYFVLHSDPKGHVSSESIYKTSYRQNLVVAKKSKYTCCRNLQM